MADDTDEALGTAVLEVVAVVVVLDMRQTSFSPASEAYHNQDCDSMDPYKRYALQKYEQVDQREKKSVRYRSCG